MENRGRGGEWGVMENRGMVRGTEGNINGE